MPEYHSLLSAFQLPDFLSVLLWVVASGSALGGVWLAAIFSLMLAFSFSDRFSLRFSPELWIERLNTDGAMISMPIAIPMLNVIMRMSESEPLADQAKKLMAIWALF